MIIWKSKELLKKVDVIKDAVAKEGAELVLKKAKSLVPVKTGVLKSQIEIRAGEFEDGGYAVVAQGSGNYDKYYAIFVELGTPNKKGERRGTTEAQPFLRPALNKSKRKIYRRFQEELDKL